MLGYLNAPSPLMRKGWFNANDMVEVDGDYIRILGRKTEIINVGGQKVYPAEVESVLLQLDNVTSAVVIGEPHPITGNIVTAREPGTQPEDAQAFRRRMRHFAADRLASLQRCRSGLKSSTTNGSMRATSVCGASGTGNVSEL